MEDRDKVIRDYLAQIGRQGGKARAALSESSKKSIADLERDQEAFKKIYDSLVASIGRSEMSGKVEAQANADTFRILDPAVLPIEPVGAPRWKIILLGIFAGIAGGRRRPSRARGSSCWGRCSSDSSRGTSRSTPSPR